MVSVLQLRRSDERDELFSDETQQRLARWNRDRLEPRLPGDDWQEAIDCDAAMLRLQADFLEALRAQVADRARAAPTEAQAFLGWFEDLEQSGPGQHDPLFDWLEAEAGL